MLNLDIKIVGDDPKPIRIEPGDVFTARAMPDYEYVCVRPSQRSPYGIMGMCIKSPSRADYGPGSQVGDVAVVCEQRDVFLLGKLTGVTRTSL